MPVFHPAAAADPAISVAKQRAGIGRAPRRLAALVLAISLLITYGLWQQAKLQAVNSLQAEFDFRVRDTAQLITQRMATYQQVLRGVKGFMMGSLDVERSKFSAYVAALRLDERYPGIQAIGLAEIVPKARIDEHVAAIRSQGFAGYTLNPAGEREVYTAITHIEPFNPMNRRAFGFDMFSQPVRRAAMSRARDTGRTTLSGKVTLVQEAQTDVQPGFLMYLPVYRSGMAIDTTEQRRAAILGWVYAPFRINDFMAGLGGERSADLNLRIYDNGAMAKEACLFGCADAGSRPPLFRTGTSIEIAGRPWLLEVSSTPAFERQLDRADPRKIGIAGIGISLLLASLVWALASSRSRALALALDMTRELRTSEFRWKFALEGAGDGVWDWNLQTGEVTYSQRWKDMLGYADNDIEPSLDAWDQRLHPQDKSGALAALDDYIHGKVPAYAHEHRLQCKDGGWKWIFTRGMAVSRDQDGKPLRIIGTHTDITERKQAEEREAQRQQALEEARAALQHAQKLEAVGKLTGGVAHDFNNTLQIISGNLQLLLTTKTDEAQRRQRLHSALQAVERGAKLSSQLLSFARRQPLQPLAVNIGRLVRNMDEMMRRVLGASIDIETIVAGGLWNTLVDPHQLENVILNLAINARDAMKTGGKLTIEIGNAMLDDDHVLSQPELPAGQYVMLAVSDTGAGMDADVMARAFDPFFTTKPEGEGTGLGLSMAYGFVKQSGGHIRLYSEPGHGTTVRIYLPRCFDAEQEVASIAGKPVVGGSETILVVEDDSHVQATVVAMLSDLGYRVIKADNAQSALDILKSGEPVDLLFTDVVMPGPLRSPELARQAQLLLPNLAVLFTSGYTQNAIVHGGKLDAGVELLSKPYRQEQLARKVRHVLANQRQQAASTQALQSNEPPAAPAGAPQHAILVVEDNADLLQMACELLTLLGHQPSGVTSAEQALDLLAGNCFDILLTDVSLPGMSGVQLAQQAAARHPQMKIIFATGFGDLVQGSQGMRAMTLTKPYDLAALQAALA